MIYKLYVDGQFLGYAEAEIYEDELHIRSEFIKEPRPMPPFPDDVSDCIEAMKQREADKWDRLLQEPKDWPAPINGFTGRATPRTRSAREAARGPPAVCVPCQ